MKITTLENLLAKAQEKANNKNAQTYINSCVKKFNDAQDLYKCDYVSGYAYGAWTEISIYNNENGNRVKTIRVSYP